MIRTMTVADTDKVYRIETSSFFRPMPKKDLVSDIEKNKHKRHFVYDKNGETVGFYIISKILDEVEIYTIAVDELYRGQKIASNMLEHLINFSREMKVSKIWLEVSTKNMPAINLYEKFGFEKIRLRKNYYSLTNEDAYIMLKELI
ncbi:ribosomal protein S18-alanine N-acetyltransferase [Anaerococcus hydrogenalis]|uniref:[Ribosomal protein bS18]-alanine N-acetyltransferase n=1 Tax=Anaerococcus hydrogenalis ACS-025-V-Sch4 TaxID=879306 RepID=F0GYL0_9FIRM|nr:ribosomal protein S18-alanine N-acetyltransferase [Anaerococcus hydrogenalis]EGC84706.1 ribosomal-protein-alanine acetyltransferase [Anaerococcus hydrogenalis ACS-025-V-Sch4]